MSKYTIDELKETNLNSCYSILKEYQLKPYFYYSKLVDEAKLENYFIHWIKSKINNPNHKSIYIQIENKVKGLAGYTYLPWDTKRMGVKVARIDYLISTGDYHKEYFIKNLLLNEITLLCKAEEIQYLIARVNSLDFSSIHVLEQNGFIIVDGILTFYIDINQYLTLEFRKNEIQVFELKEPNKEEIEQIVNIAQYAFKYDRFHSDPFIPNEKANQIHAEWVANSYSKKIADAIIVASRNGKILSFVTCKIEQEIKEYLNLPLGIIVLVATDVKAQGMGIGKITTLGALNWFAQRGVNIVEVGTQLQNIPASRLYESCGFKLVNTSLTLRKLINS